MRTLETKIRLMMFHEAKEAFEKKKAKKVGSKDELEKIKKDVAQLKKDVKSKSVDDEGDDPKSKVAGKDKSKKDGDEKHSKKDPKEAKKDKGDPKSKVSGKRPPGASDKGAKLGDKPGEEPADQEIDKTQKGDDQTQNGSGKPPAAPEPVKSQAAEKLGKGKEPASDDKVTLGRQTPILINPTLKDTELASPDNVVTKRGPDHVNEVKINDKLRRKVEKRQHVTDYGVNFKIKGKHLRNKFKKNLKSYMKGEEVEQIDELSLSKIGRGIRHAIAGPSMRERLVSKVVQKAKDSRATKDRGRRARQFATMKQSRQGMCEDFDRKDWLSSCTKLHNLRVELTQTQDPKEYKRIYDEIGTETAFHLKTFALSESEEHELNELFGWAKKLFGKGKKETGPMPKKIQPTGGRRSTGHSDMDHMDHFHKAVEHHNAYNHHLDQHEKKAAHYSANHKHMDKDDRRRHKADVNSDLQLAHMHRRARQRQMTWHFHKAPHKDLKANLKHYKRFLDEAFYGPKFPKPRKPKDKYKPRLNLGVVNHAVKRFGKAIKKYSHHPVEKMLGLENAQQYNKALSSQELSANDTES